MLPSSSMRVEPGYHIIYNCSTKGAHKNMQGPLAYTDGACLGNPGPGGWGVRILYANGTAQEYGGAATATTNNRMELQAAIEALKIIGGSPQATIITDSRYVIDGVTRWIHAWRRRKWMTTSATPVKNRQWWLTLDGLNHPGIRWQHIRGHTGDPQNERVDAIARAFAQGDRPRLFCGQIGSPSDPVATEVSPTPRGSAKDRGAFSQVQYVSIIAGTVWLDDDWPSCATRVHGVSGARYKKVRNAEELTAFCVQHGVEPPLP